MNSKISFLIIAFLTLFGSWSVHAPSASAAQHEVNGWAWSSNIGWVSFNCRDISICGTSNYATYVGDDHKMTGWAWSSSVGWIKFGGLASAPNIPSSDGDAYVSTSTGQIFGWARACSGSSNGNCAGPDRNDGWNGWIELTGPNHPASVSSGNGGAYYDKTRNVFRGYAWGSQVVGWLNLAPTIAGQPGQPAPNPYSIRCIDGCGTGNVVRQITGVCTASALTINKGDPITYTVSNTRIAGVAVAPNTLTYGWNTTNWPNNWPTIPRLSEPGVFSKQMTYIVPGTYQAGVVISNGTDLPQDVSCGGDVTVKDVVIPPDLQLHTGPTSLTVAQATNQGAARNKTYTVRRGKQFNIVWIDSNMPANTTCSASVTEPGGAAGDWNSYLSSDYTPDTNPTGVLTLTAGSAAPTGKHTFNLSCNKDLQSWVDSVDVTIVDPLVQEI